MKKTVLLIATAIASVGLFVACNKSVEGPSKRAVVTITVTGGDATKVTGITSNDPTTEAKVNRLEVFVFNGTELDGHNVSTTGATSIDVNCTSGTRDVYAIINGPDLSAETTKAAITSALVNLGATQNDFAMYSFADGEGRVLADGTPLALNVKRLAARVVIKGVKNDLINPTDAAACTLDAIYLTNVAGNMKLGGGVADTEVFYNRQGYESTNSLGANDYDAIGSAIAKDATYGTAHYFYSLPNAYTPAVGGAWSPRRAKLVVKCTMAGDNIYYPITLPVLESNKSYEINLLTLVHRGNDDTTPDKEENPIDPSGSITLGINITVTNWDVVLLNGDGNIVL